MNFERARAPLFIFVFQFGCHASGIFSDRPGNAAAGPYSPKGPFDETSQRGVVMLALADPEENEYGEEQEKDLSSGRAETGAKPENPKKSIFRMQMSIAEEIAGTETPFFLFVKSTSVRRAIYARCMDHPRVCDALGGGHARLVEMDYDGVWIRDYGPQFVVRGPGEIIINDASYHDLRLQQATDDRINAIDNERLNLVKRRQSDINLRNLLARYSTSEVEPDDGSAGYLTNGGSLSPGSSRRQRRASPQQGEGDAARKAALEAATRRRRDEAERLRREQEEVGDKLMLMQQERDALSNLKLRDRVRDDRSPYHVAEAVLAVPDFKVEHPPIDLDGGNIMHMDDGRCITTGGLIERNQAREATVDQTLSKYYGCEKTVFLRPLPGHVIEHVDMFLLRAGKKLLLATYDPAIPEIQEHLKKQSDGMRTLVIEAATAMEENYRRLTALDYEVIRVPSPLPVSRGGRVYYPTILNGLAWISPNNQSNLILPSYASYEEDVQRLGVAVIGKAFAGAHVSQVEAGTAAELQGAVHCLTLVAPYDNSWFYNQEQTGVYARITKNVLDLHRREIAKILSGSWTERRGLFRFTFGEGSLTLATPRMTESLAVDETDVSRGNEDVRLRFHDIASNQPVVLSVDCRDSDHLIIRHLQQDGTRYPEAYVLRRDVR